MKLAYGLLGIIALVPFVSPLPASAEEAPEATVTEQTELIIPDDLTTSIAQTTQTSTEALLDPCLICPIPVVTPAPVAPPPEPVVTPAPPAPPEPEVSSPTPAPVPLPPIAHPAHSVLINEFVSDPTDGVEWIEIINMTEEEIDLTGWAVKDATTAKTILAAQSLPGLSYFVVQNPKGRLNNDGDSIFLFDATGATIDAISYDKTTAPKKGTSLARTSDGTWKSADPTPLALNTWPDASPAPAATETISPDTTTYASTNNTSADLGNTQSDTGTSQGIDPPTGTPSPVRVELDPPMEESLDSPSVSTLHESGQTAVTSTASSTTRTAAPVITATEITNYAANTTVTVEGVLVAGPGTFGKQLAYVDGLEIYFNKADWPKLSTMTRVRITGTVDVKTDYTRLKLKTRTDIKVIEPDSVAPDVLEMLEDASHGSLMSLSGSVVDVVGKNLTVGLDSGELITVTSAKDASVDFSALAFDDRIAVTGVVRQIKGAWILNILEQTGLTTLQAGSTASSGDATTNSPVAASSKEGEALHSNTSIKPPTKQVPWVGGGLLTTSIGALGYWFAKAKGITLPSFS